MTPDSIDADVMEEPQWPRCGSCGVDLRERRDPKTGRVVREGGRAMLECPACGEVSIGPSPIRRRRRYRIVHWLIIVSTVAAGVALIVTRIVQGLGPDRMTFGWGLAAIMVVGAAFTLHLLLESAARAMSPDNPAGSRFESWALVLFYAIVLTLVVGTAVMLWKTPDRHGVWSRPLEGATR